MENAESTLVTSQKTKNPGRQEWGRKLGKMSKERKLMAKEASPPELCSVKTEPKPDSSNSLWYALGFSVIGLGALYYVRNNKKEKTLDPSEENPTVKPPLFVDF